MSKLITTEHERKVIDSILDSCSHVFWAYGDKEACFKEDVELMIYLCLRNEK